MYSFKLFSQIPVDAGGYALEILGVELEQREDLNRKDIGTNYTMLPEREEFKGESGRARLDVALGLTVATLMICSISGVLSRLQEYHAKYNAGMHRLFGIPTITPTPFQPVPPTATYLPTLTPTPTEIATAVQQHIVPTLTRVANQVPVEYMSSDQFNTALAIAIGGLTFLAFIVGGARVLLDR